VNSDSGIHTDIQNKSSAQQSERQDLSDGLHDFRVSPGSVNATGKNSLWELSGVKAPKESNASHF